MLTIYVFCFQTLTADVKDARFKLEPTTGQLVDRVVIRVNDDVVTLMDIYESLKLPLDKTWTWNENKHLEIEQSENYQKALNQLLLDKLLAQKVKELKLKAKKSDIDQAMQGVMKDNNLSEKQLELALQKEGQTIFQYRQALRKQIEQYRLMDRVVRKRVQIKEEDIQAYYQKLLKDVGAEKKVHLHDIFLGYKQENKAEVKEKAAWLKKESLTGDAFSRLAREHSELPGAKENGGDLGTTPLKDLHPAFQSAIKNLKEGDVSDVVEIEGSCHILKVVKWSFMETQEYKDVAPKLKNQLYQTEMKKQFDLWVEELKKQAHIEMR